MINRSGNSRAGFNILYNRRRNLTTRNCNTQISEGVPLVPVAYAHTLTVEIQYSKTSVTVFMTFWILVNLL